VSGSRVDAGGGKDTEFTCETKEKREKKKSKKLERGLEGQKGGKPKNGSRAISNLLRHEAPTGERKKFQSFWPFREKGEKEPLNFA